MLILNKISNQYRSFLIMIIIILISAYAAWLNNKITEWYTLQQKNNEILTKLSILRSNEINPNISSFKEPDMLDLTHKLVKSHHLKLISIEPNSTGISRSHTRSIRTQIAGNYTSILDTLMEFSHSKLPLFLSEFHLKSDKNFLILDWVLENAYP